MVLQPSQSCKEFCGNGNSFVLFTNTHHGGYWYFISMMGGRNRTKNRRLVQVNEVVNILKKRWASSNYRGNFIVMGDFNDYRESHSSLLPLLNHPNLENVVARLPQNQQWTHYWKGGNKYSQFDYLLLSKTLSESNSGLPIIVRKGLPKRATKYTGSRFANIGFDNPKASDQAAMYMDLNLV